MGDWRWWWEERRGRVGETWRRGFIWLCVREGISVQFSSVQFSGSVVSDSLRPHELQHARPPVHHQLPEFTQTCVHSSVYMVNPNLLIHSPWAPSTHLFSTSESLFLPCKNTIRRDGDGPRVLQSEISQVEKNQILFIINTHMWNLRGLFYIHHLQGINFISTRCYTFFPLVYHFLGKKVNYDFIWLLLSSISHFTN